MLKTREGRPPEGTRKIISSTVRQLMKDFKLKSSHMAPHFGVGVSYFPRKMSEGRWDIDDLDILADIFHLNPADFVLGYKHIMDKEMEREEEDE